MSENEQAQSLTSHPSLGEGLGVGFSPGLGVGFSPELGVGFPPELGVGFPHEQVAGFVDSDCYRIGRLGKPHGVKGSLLFHFDDDIFDRADADYLILDVDGILVPFFIEEYRFRTDTTAIMKFEGIDSQDRARDFTNADVFFHRALTPTDDEAELRWSFFVGFDIIEATSGRNVGRIASVDDQTANILFELEDGRLIPAAEELITDVDHNRRRITINLPAGLLEL